MLSSSELIRFIDFNREHRALLGNLTSNYLPLPGALWTVWNDLCRSLVSSVLVEDVGRFYLIKVNKDVTDHKREEERRLKRETLLSLMLNAGPGCINRVASDGTLLYVNPAGLRMLELDEEETFGRSVFDVVVPEYRTSFIDMHRAVIKGASRTLQFEIQGFKGTRRWMETFAVPFLNPVTGNTEHLAVTHDITERKRTESLLQSSEEKLRQALTASNIGLWGWNTETNEVQFSHEWKRQLGYEEAELPDTFDTWEQRLHPDDHAGAIAYARAYLAWPEGDYQQEFRLRHKDGTYRWIEARASFVAEPDGRRVRLLGAHTDITERKRTEDNLRKSEVRLKEAQHLAHIGSWELDLTTNRLDWSDEIYRIFEIDRHSFGASYEAFLSAVHPDDRSAVNHRYTESVRNKNPYEIVHRLLMPDGRMKYVQERCETIYDAEGKPQRSFGTVQDVTERMRLAEREAARLEQLKKLSELGLTLSGDPSAIFERIVRMIGDLFKVRVVCLSEIVGHELHFKVVYCTGEVVRDAGRCPLAATPCATVEKHKDLRLFDRVMERFPQASFLRDHQAVSYCGFPALDAHGRVVAVTCLLDDKPREFTAEEQELLRVFGQRITIELERARYLADQQRHADELQRSHAFIRQIIDTTPNFIFAKDREGRFLVANQAVAQAYGTTVENLLGKTDADFNLDQSEVEFFRRKDLQVMDSLQEWSTSEEKITDATGTVRWLQTVKRPILDEQGYATMVLGASTDITKRKMAEDALRLTQYAVDHADDFIFVIGPDGSFIDVNESACRRLGYSKQELLSMSVMDIDQGFQSPRWDTFWKEFRHTKLIHLETTHRSKSGEIYPVEVTANYILHEGRELDYAIARDITNRKRLEATLIQHTEDLERLVDERTAKIAKLEVQRAHTERLAALGQLAAGVAHEINNPIAGIKNAFQLVKQAIPETHPNYQFVGMIDREINRTVSIVRQMYELYSSEPRRTESVDLALLIGDLTKLFNEKLSQQNLVLTTDLPASFPRVRVSRGDLLQVLANLVQNAIDCSCAGESVTLSVYECDGCLRVAVADQGPGIPPDVLSKIFDPFFTTKTKGGAKGMGLGLSVSHNLVRAMGGKIEVETQENQGTTFTVVLPLATASGEPSETLSELWEELPHD